MHLDQRCSAQGDSVVQGVRVVGEGGGVQHDRHLAVGRFVQPADQLGLGVGLPDVDGQATLGTVGHAALGEVSEGSGAVDLGLTGAQPTEVGAVDLAWDSNDQIALIPVNFSFERIGMSGARSGDVQSDLSRSFGLLEYITSIANIGQTIKSFRKPRDVQDAINQFTSIKTVFSRLGSLF